MANENTYLLEMRDICKSFSGVEVLRNASFDLRPSEVHILAGENGAGKSTLIKILAGVHTDFDGTINLGGNPVSFKSVHDAAAHGISVIHQELSLVRQMNVAENIFLGREKTRGPWLNRKKMFDEAASLLKNVGLDIDVRGSVGDYPLSVQQMIEMCKALAFDARIIVMDEPTSALSEPEVEQLFSIIGHLKNRGCGIIYISHKMEEIYRIADRITVLRDGKYIGTAEASQLDRNQLVKWMVGRELNQQFVRQRPSLGPVCLKVSDFSVANPGEKTGLAVDNVSLSVRGGEILGIGGLQGSGNSELLNGIFGSYGKAAYGKIEIDGIELSRNMPKHSIRQGMALLTNDRKETGLVMTMDIIQNATLASLRKFSPAGWLRPKNEAEYVSGLAGSLRLKAASLNQDVEHLSGGNQQKVVLAKWMSTMPKVLLLDEPTRGVDVGAKHEIYRLMNEWTAEGIAIVLITSEMPELLAMSDRIIVMHRGTVTAEFSAEEATQERILQAAMGERIAV